MRGLLVVVVLALLRPTLAPYRDPVHDDVAGDDCGGRAAPGGGSQAVPMTCGRRFPVLTHGRTYYVTCDLPTGHDHPCSGRAHDYGAPRI